MASAHGSVVDGLCNHMDGLIGLGHDGVSKWAGRRDHAQKSKIMQVPVRDITTKRVLGRSRLPRSDLARRTVAIWFGHERRRIVRTALPFRGNER